jgi:hypothetical protein
MDVRDRQQLVMTGREPFIASAVLTLGTMAIATTVIGNGAMAATRALIAMSAQHGEPLVKAQAQSMGSLPHA